MWLEDASLKSNIVLVKLKPEVSAAPSRPKPTSPSASKDATSPQSKLNFSCVSSANEETEVYIDGSLADTKPAVPVGQTITHSESGLANDTTMTGKFRHKWSAGDESEFTAEKSATTDPATAPPSKPSNGEGEFVSGSGSGSGFVTFG